MVSDVRPVHGLASRNTVVTISGQWLNRTALQYVHFGDKYTWKADQQRYNNHWQSHRDVWGTYLPSFWKLCLVIRRICIEIVRPGWGLGGIVLVIRQYRKSQILVSLSDEKCDCTIDCNKKLSYRRETARQLCMSSYLPRLANWSCNAQNTAESQRLYYFWHSNALIPEVLAENAFCYEIAAQSHSRSFTLQSFASRQGVAYRHILSLAVSLKFSKT